MFLTVFCLITYHSLRFYSRFLQFTNEQKGVVVIWSVDSRGGLSAMRQYKKKGEITTAIFCVVSSKSAHTDHHQSDINNGGASTTAVSSSAAATSSKALQSYASSFFFGTDRGVIAYADDMGHCSDVQQLSSSIDTMLFFEERSRLTIITRSLLLTMYYVAEDGKISRVQQVKLSVPGDVAIKGIRSVDWAGPGLLAAATEEKMVRLLDLAADESYNLSLVGALGDVVDRSDRVLCVAFSPIDRWVHDYNFLCRIIPI